MMIKICGITRREDAKMAVEAGANALGFIFFEKSPRYVTPAIAAQLGAGLTAWKVGVFVDETPALIESVMLEAKLDIAQIYGGAARPGTRVWKAFRGGKVTGTADEAEAILLDGPGNGVPFDWRTARGVVEKLGIAEKLIVAGGLDASNIAEAIQAAHPWGVDASSRLESAPGIKDREKVRQFISAAQEAE